MFEIIIRSAFYVAEEVFWVFILTFLAVGVVFIEGGELLVGEKAPASVTFENGLFKCTHIFYYLINLLINDVLRAVIKFWIQNHY